MHSDPDQRAKLLGDELTQTIDEIGAVFTRNLPPAWADDVTLLCRLFGDFWAHTLGRATVLASSAVVSAIKTYEERLAAVERAVGERPDGDA